MKKYRWLKFVLFISPKKSILGIDTYAGFLLSKSEKCVVFNKVRDALNLIKMYMPVYFEKFSKDVDSITIMGLPTFRGQYIKDLKMIEVYDEFVLSSETSSELLASTIVHEAQHARLFRLGFGYEEHQRNRIETICRKAQRLFGKRIPNGQEIIDEINSWLKLDTSNDYTEQAFYDSQIAGLRKLNTPEWIIKFILWFSN